MEGINPPSRPGAGRGRKGTSRSRAVSPIPPREPGGPRRREAGEGRAKAPEGSGHGSACRFVPPSIRYFTRWAPWRGRSTVASSVVGDWAVPAKRSPASARAPAPDPLNPCPLPPAIPVAVAPGEVHDRTGARTFDRASGCRCGLLPGVPLRRTSARRNLAPVPPAAPRARPGPLPPSSGIFRRAFGVSPAVGAPRRAVPCALMLKRGKP